VKRYLESYAERYKDLNPVYLGDDIYACYPVCQLIASKGQHFLFTCKPETHKNVYETVAESYPKRKKVREYLGKKKCKALVRRYQWVNGVDIRDERPSMKVNWVYMEEENESTGEKFKNAWVTDIEITEENVEEVCKVGRARWKIENEHNNTLKNYGYHLEHNFGHGKEHACEIYVLLNLLAFLFHSLMWVFDEGYRRAYVSVSCGRRDEFFNGLRYVWNRFVFENWEEFIDFVEIKDGERPYG
jgi:hypothetical protein